MDIFNIFPQLKDFVDYKMHYHYKGDFWGKKKIKDTGSILSNVYKIRKMHLSVQKMRGTDEDQGRGNTDPCDPNMPNSGTCPCGTPRSSKLRSVTGGDTFYWGDICIFGDEGKKNI